MAGAWQSQSPREARAGNCSLDTVEHYMEWCLEHADDPNCYPFSPVLSLWAGVWCVVNAVVGFSGNLLTLVAIPRAILGNKFGFRRGWETTPIFILNLAFSDLLYCVFNLPFYAVHYFYRGWPLSASMCFGTAFFRYVNAFADWMSLAMIALSRCLHLVWPDVGRRIFTGKRGIGVIVLIWVYSIALLTPFLDGSAGTLGYNCMNGKCDFIQTSESEVEPHQIFYLIGFSVPCAIILTSYLIIWRNARSSTYLQKSCEQNESKKLQNRDNRMTSTILIVCFCYLFFVMPITILNAVDVEAAYPELQLIFFCFYWVQFSFNFVVYAARSEQYRRAYADLLRGLCCCLRSDRSDWNGQGRSQVGGSRNARPPNRTIVLIVDGDGHLRRRRLHHHHHHAQNGRDPFRSVSGVVHVRTVSAGVELHEMGDVFAPATASVAGSRARSSSLSSVFSSTSSSAPATLVLATQCSASAADAFLLHMVKSRRRKSV